MSAAGNAGDGREKAASNAVGVSAVSSSGNGDSKHAQGSTSSDGGIEEEDQEESSSSQSNTEEEDLLATFREQWQRELEITPKCKEDLASSLVATTKAKSSSAIAEDNSNLSTTEDKATSFFLQGIEHEQNGKLYEAIQFYRRAVQLVPDIEFRLYETNKQKQHREHVAATVDNNIENPVNQLEQELGTSSDSESEGGLDLMTRLQRVFSRSCYVCTSLEEQKSTHFSALPMEIVLYILRWVVSSDLDLRSLELCSQVCRGFYICSRDPEIWRLACARVWGVNCGSLTNYVSWRQMFIERPRLHFSGCYISKTTYVRQGENSFQDQFYRPWHLIEYYRYLRFFPEGLVLMLTTSEDPQFSLAHLKQRTSRNSAILSGHYRLHDDRVLVVLKKQDASGSKLGSTNRFRARKRENLIQADFGDQTFNIELQIHSQRSRAHAQLVWLKYTICKCRGSQETTTNLDLPISRYPAFWFSRVKSYSAESETPLQ